MLEQLLGSGVRSGPIDSGPGPQEFIGGDVNAGFYGEVLATEFITGPALATAVGLVDGVSQFPNEPWLKFSLGRKTLFVAKKTYRHTLAWYHLNNANILNGTRAIAIGDRTYKVRVLKTFAGTGFSWSGGNIYTWAPGNVNGSEWNKLMYHVAGKPFGNANNTLAAEGITEGDWAKYTEAELHMFIATGKNGVYSISPERHVSYGHNLSRGGQGVSYAYTQAQDTAIASLGWRPCLELVV